MMSFIHGYQWLLSEVNTAAGHPDEAGSDLVWSSRDGSSGDKKSVLELFTESEPKRV
jgi:hypothetical protein